MRWNSVAPIALKKRKRFTPARSAERSSRTVASPFSSSIVPRGWSRIVAARWITVSTPRIAWRIENGSARSPSAICTLTRSGPSRLGSRTSTRTSCPDPSSSGNSSPPITPVAPVNRIMAPE